MLVDPEGALRERSHWQLRAFELLVATILWTLYAEERKTLARIAELLADPKRPVADLLDDMLKRKIKVARRIPWSRQAPGSCSTWLRLNGLA